MQFLEFYEEFVMPLKILYTYLLIFYYSSWNIYVGMYVCVMIYNTMFEWLN